MYIGHLNYFEVENCGLYSVGSTDPKALQMSETFKEVAQWVQGRNLPQTLPWEPGTTKKGISLCYCKDVYSDVGTGDFVFVLWKSETGSNATLLGAEEGANTGSNKVHEYTSDHKGKKVIWGRPCYYWVIPSKKLIVSIKFDNSLCDSKMFQMYIKSCVENRIKHADRQVTFTEHDYVRISHNSGEYKNLLFRFNIHLKSMATSGLQLNKLVPKITSIVKRETIVVKSENEKAIWLKHFEKIPFMKAESKAKRRKIEVTAEAKPTVDEVSKLIEEFAVENRSSSDWDNVGFVTDSGTTWADTYRLKGEIAPTPPASKVYVASELWAYLEPNRERLLYIAKDQELKFSEKAS